MRSFSIMTRVLKELIRDKRTLLLMFLAPVLILIMLNFIFSSSQTTNIKVGTVSTSQKLMQELDRAKHVSAKDYSTMKAANKALATQKIDAIIKADGQKFDITYANTDSAKTMATKLAFKNALTAQQTAQMKDKLSSTAKLLAQLKSQLPNLPIPADNPADTVRPTLTNHYVYGDSNTGFFNKILPILLGFFVFFFVFLISGMALLKERTSGTLDRLLATPVKRSEIVFGYMMSYGILAIFQTLLIVFVTVWLLKIEVVGNVLYVVLINLVLALVALAFGILVSTFANSEFQMMQFIPLLTIPQIFFSGIIPLDSLASWVKAISYIIPIKYSGDAASRIIMQGAPITSLGFDFTILLLFLVVLTILNIVGLKRYRKV